MRPQLGLFQQMAAAPGNDLLAMLQVMNQHALDRQEPWLPVDQGQHRHTEGGLHRRELEQLAQDLAGLDRAGQLDADPHPLPVRLIPQVGDTLDLAIAHQFGNALDQACLVDLVGQLGDHNAAAVAAHLLDVHVGLHLEPPSTHSIGVPDQIQAIAVVILAGITVDDAAGGEIRALDEAGQVLDGHVVQFLVVVDQVEEGIDHLAQVMRRDAGSHTYGDARRAIHQQVGQHGRQHRGLGQGIVKVGGKVHRLLVDVGQHLLGDRGHAGLGVAHGCRAVAVDGAKVPLSIHQNIAQAKVLRHAGHRLVHSGVAVGVILAQHFTDDAGALFVGPVGPQPHVVHGIQNAAVDRLQAVAHIGQGPGHDDAHGIVQIGALHFVIYVDLPNSSDLHRSPPRRLAIGFLQETSDAPHVW